MTVLTYFIISFICLAVFSYFATEIDNRFKVGNLEITFGVGCMACAVWPVTIIGGTIYGLLFFLMQLGTKHRGER